MSAKKKQEKIDKILKSLKNVNHKTKVTLLEEINKEILIFLETNNSDATDGAFDTLSRILESVQEESDELLNIDSDKKYLSGRCQRYSPCC